MLDEAREARRPLRWRIAWWVSVLAHPFVLVPVLVALVASRSLPPQRAAAVVAFVMAGSILPLLWMMVRRVRSGAWTDHDVSVREQRRGLYPVALALVTATILLLLLIDPPRPVLHGTVAVLALIGTASIINLWFKVSLHTAFAWFTAVCLYSMSLALGAGASLVALAVAWSRVELRRHTLAEVLGGILLGVAIGVMLLFWPR